MRPDALPPTFVVGLGLIGGSLVRALAPHVEIRGWSPGEATRTAARADGFTVDDDLREGLHRAAAQDALVVIATPVPAFASVLAVIDEVAPTIRLTDVASVKVAVADQVEALTPRARYVGSHPMAGTAHSGWAAGSADLFRDAAWVTCLTEDSDLDVWAAVAALGLQVGSRVVPTEAPAHDRAVARISHLPHLLALALAQAGAAGGDLALALAASSFADGTRVAGTRPELIRAMCENNRDALLDAVDDALGLLGVARGSLASTGSLVKLTESGHAARQAFEQRGAGLEDVTLSGDDLIDQLLAVGAAGGCVTGLRDDGAGWTVDARYPADPVDAE